MDRIYKKQEARRKAKASVKKRKVMYVTKQPSEDDLESTDSMSTVTELLKKEHLYESDLQYIENRLSTDDISQDVSRIIGDLRKTISVIYEDEPKLN